MCFPHRCLVILGHCGGCVSVLNMHSGKIQYRTSAHNNQNISSMQAYPNGGYLLTAGAHTHPTRSTTSSHCILFKSADDNLDGFILQVKIKLCWFGVCSHVLSSVWNSISACCVICLLFWWHWWEPNSPSPYKILRMMLIAWCNIA